MKIAYLINQYPKVSHTFIRREIRALEAAGVAVLRFTIRGSGEALTDPEDRAELGRTRVILGAGMMRLGWTVLGMMLRHPIRLARGLMAAAGLARTSNRSLAIHLVYLAEACLLKRWLAAEGAEHLHVHFGTNPAAVALLCRLMGGPSYSITVHGPDEFDAAPVLALDRKAHAAFSVIGISAYSCSQLARWVDAEDCGKLATIHCGLDETFLAGASAPISEQPRFVFVGRLTATKGVFILLEAVRQLRERGQVPTLVMIGDGPDRGAVEAKIAEYGLKDSVKLLGWAGSDVVRGEILGARALVLPSFAEGLPVVLMESLALCRPVISTWVAGIPELVENGLDGWLVPPGSPGALAQAMEESMQTTAARLDEMGRHGRKKVLREHSASTEAAKLAGMFRRAVELA